MRKRSLIAAISAVVAITAIGFLATPWTWVRFRHSHRDDLICRGRGSWRAFAEPPSSSEDELSLRPANPWAPARWNYHIELCGLDGRYIMGRLFAGRFSS